MYTSSKGIFMYQLMLTIKLLLRRTLQRSVILFNITVMLCMKFIRQNKYPNKAGLRYQFSGLELISKNDGDGVCQRN